MVTQNALPGIIDTVWLPARDGDKRAFDLFQRHYSSLPYADGRRADPYYRNRWLIVGPGEKMVLLTAQSDALFVWRKFINDRGDEGVNCAVFRNESCQRSSDLILAAEQLAWVRWPGERLYTYVNPRAIRSTNPGYCFQVAGWQKCGVTTKGLIVLEKLPGLDHGTVP